jgi:hypothetical protein
MSRKKKDPYDHDAVPAWSTFRHHPRFSTVVVFDTVVHNPSSSTLTPDRFMAATDRILFIDGARNELAVHFERIL